MPEFKPVTNGERRRIYTYANGSTFTVENVSDVAISKSGNHRLNTKDGRKFIVMAGWIAIEVDADFWSF